MVLRILILRRSEAGFSIDFDTDVSLQWPGNFVCIIRHQAYVRVFETAVSLHRN